MRPTDLDAFLRSGSDAERERTDGTPTTPSVRLTNSEHVTRSGGCVVVRGAGEAVAVRGGRVLKRRRTRSK